MKSKLTKPQILKDEEIEKAFGGDFGEVHFDHKPTPDEILLIKLKLVAEAQRDDTFRETWEMVLSMNRADNPEQCLILAYKDLETLNQLAGGK